MKVTFNASLPVKLTKRSKWVVASCPILDVHSQGKNITEAKKNLIETLSLFFISCFERGTLDAVLKDRGFTPGKRIVFKKAKHITPSQEYINVPIPFLVKPTGHTRCHV